MASVNASRIEGSTLRSGDIAASHDSDSGQRINISDATSRRLNAAVASACASGERGELSRFSQHLVYFSSVQFFGMNHLPRKLLQCDTTTFDQAEHSR